MCEVNSVCSDLLGVQISEPRPAECAKQAQPECGEPGDHIDGAAAAAALAHNAAGGCRREDDGDQEALREAKDECALARGGDEIGAGAPAPNEPSAADRPPGDRRCELTRRAGPVP